MISTFAELHQQVLSGPVRTVALAAAADPVLIEAASRAQIEGIARFVLVGKAAQINSLLPTAAPAFQIMDSDRPARDAVTLVRQGQADLLMKGRIPTGTLLKAVLDRNTGLCQGELLNHIAVIQSPAYHKLLFISDGGINLHFDSLIYEQMIVNIVAYLQLLDITEPKFGMLALIETVNEKIPETVIAQQVVAKLAGKYLIEGPIAPDVALSRQAAEKKGLDSSIAGEVDVFLMPNTTAANHLVKGLSALGGCQTAGVIVGASVPIILLSRSDDAETKYRSILLGLV